MLWVVWRAVSPPPHIFIVLSPSPHYFRMWLWCHWKKCSVRVVLFRCYFVSDSLWPPWAAAHRASLSVTISLTLLKLMSIESGMPYNLLILCHPLLLLPSIFPSIRVFSNESSLHIWWPKYWSFSIRWPVAPGWVIGSTADSDSWAAN